jgi:cytoplasmic iron level regulating protein YaaA (DUF328/UPF0246 family)
MLIVLSPAKTLDFETKPVTDTYTVPEMLSESKVLVKELKKLKPTAIAELMGVSDKIAKLNADRFKAFKTPFTPDNAKQAVLAFKGDVYQGLKATRYKEKDLAFAQQHLRILSGLYGLLKPLDLIQPYRLEMGTSFKNERGKDLYAFWDDGITKALNKALKAQKDDVLVNLASNEYFKAVKPKLLKGKIITPVFKEYKNGKYAVIGLLAKKARGMMADYIISNRLTNPEDMKAFKQEGYRFDARLSKANEWVFIRGK